MKPNTPCFIVDFDDYTRQACLEVLTDDDYRPTITIIDGKRTFERPGWSTTVGFALNMKSNGTTQGKNMSFRVVVARPKGSAYRYLKKAEWIVSANRRASSTRTVKTQIDKVKERKLVRGRLGTVQ